MKLVLALIILSFGASIFAADSLKARYPYTKFSKKEACESAKEFAIKRAVHECKGSLKGKPKTKCMDCSEKVEFGQKAWQCTAEVNFQCIGSSRAEDEKAKQKSRKHVDVIESQKFLQKLHGIDQSTKSHNQ